MAKQKLLYQTSRTAGILLILATIPHATLGTAEVLTGIKVGSIREDMVHVVKNIWVFSSIMLPLSGIWVLFLSKELRQLKRKAWWQAILIGLGYAAGSILAMVWTGIQIHLIAFCMIGLLLLIPCLRWATSFSSTGNPPAS